MNNYFSIIILIITIIPRYCYAENIIRDQEIEDVIYLLAKPIIKSAKLEQNDIEIFIVNNDEINAYASLGNKIFINSGLLIEFSDPDIISAIIAHEIGHIKENHIIRYRQNARKTNNFLISNLLLSLASFASGNSDLGMGIILGASHISERNILKYSRQNEEAADSAAIKYLDDSYSSAIGLMKSFEYFSSIDKNLQNVNQYLLTHPLSKNRLLSVKDHLKNNLIKSNITPEFRKRFNRAVVKLRAFLENPEYIISMYKTDSQIDKYANSIAYYRLGKIDDSISILEQLISIDQFDHYLYELIGQIYFEYGMIDKSIDNYQKSININPESILIKIGLANSYIEKYNIVQNDKYIYMAIDLLNNAKMIDPNNSMIFKSLAISYGLIEDYGNSNLCLAEEMLLIGDNIRAKLFIDKSLLYLNIDSKEHIRAKDISEILIK